MPQVATPAQRRVLEEVVGWGGPRPVLDPELVPSLARQLAGTVDDRLGEQAAAVPRRVLDLGRMLSAASGQQDAPATGPAGPDLARAIARGALLGRGFLADVEGGHRGEVTDVVAAVTRELAALRPADPASPSAWLNAASAETRDALRAEVVAVIEDLRTVWPPIPAEAIALSTRTTPRTDIGGRCGAAVSLTARVDLLLDSRHRDDRVRALVLVTRTGMPRPAEDRARARATALIHALATGRPPFRWGVFHLTDARFETEDLDADLLHRTASDLGERVAGHLAAADGPVTGGGR